jgi:cytochrome c-type biogenesis protein CcmH/NrfG
LVEQRLIIIAGLLKPGSRNLTAALLVALLLAGCASTSPVATVEDSQQRGATGQTGPDTHSAGDRSSSLPGTTPPQAIEPNAEPNYAVPTLALLQQSQRAVGEGNLDEAIAYVERAIRMNPRDPELWLRLAELQLSADHPASAAQVARKAIALSGSGTEVQRKAWLVVADSRERQGDAEGAARIRTQWRTYRG